MVTLTEATIKKNILCWKSDKKLIRKVNTIRKAKVILKNLLIFNNYSKFLDFIKHIILKITLNTAYHKIVKFKKVFFSLL